MRKWQLDTTSACDLPARPARRRGISLLEVLISMFVLAIGLMGVAALIPAGRHEIVEAIKLENAAMVGRGAFRDIQIREYLNPALNPRDLDPTKYPVGWRDVANGTGTFGYRPDVIRTDGTHVPFAYQDPTTTSQTNYDDPNYFSNQVMVAIDPLGLTAPAGAYGTSFPRGFGGRKPPPLRRIMPFQPSSNAFACFDTIMRGSFDLITNPNTANNDLPPNQQYFNSGTNYLRRASDGNYSWIATIVSDSSKSAVDAEVTVSVAVFYKRNLRSRRGLASISANASFNTYPSPPYQAAAR